MNKIVVLRGGPSSEYEVSLKTGSSVIKHLKDDYQVIDVVIDRNGNWIMNGLETTPQKAISNADCVFNAMHGEFGEDGTIQRTLEILKVPYTGPRVLGASLSINKVLTKDIYKKNGIKTPLHKVVSQSDGDVDSISIRIFKTFPMPVVLKPIASGSSVGVSVARDYKSLRDALVSLFIRYNDVLIEEYIEGKEATVGIIENFRGQRTYPLMPVEIRKPQDREFFDYESKYSGITQELCPGEFSPAEKELMQEMARKSHDALGLRHYSRTDFRIHPRRGIYALETNSLPGLTPQSLLPKSLEPVGSSYKEFLEHVIRLATEKK